MLTSSELMWNWGEELEASRRRLESAKRSRYPRWICADCGNEHGKQQFVLSTWHEDVCGWCGEAKACTEPRDYGYPDFEHAN